MTGLLAAPPQFQAVQMPAPSPPVAPPPLVPLELALEVAHVHGAELARMLPEYRMMPLVPMIDKGRKIALVGRQHQTSWFEAVLLNPDDLNCISRTAFEVSWASDGSPFVAKASWVLTKTSRVVLTLLHACVFFAVAPHRLNAH